MKRIYEPAAYTSDNGSFWATTGAARPWPSLTDDLSVDVAVIGGGFTGLNAALHLADYGLNTAVVEAETPGWGASGRNGGFCCLGGAMLEEKTLTKRFGPTPAGQWHDIQQASVAHVADLIDKHGWEVDRHSKGETQLAHSEKAWKAMRAEASTGAELHSLQDLKQMGMDGPWKGGRTTATGFALNPQRYHDGLARAAQAAGARLFAKTCVTGLTKDGKWQLRTGGSNDPTVTADRVILATNGYSSEDLPDWLRARYLPVQSSVIVTRPLAAVEQAAAGWTSAQMAYDSRSLLHYFRLLPDGRFLFGMRGGLRATERSDSRIARKIRSDFNRLFPAWADVEITHRWSGLVCLMPGLHPFIGPVPDHPGLFAAMGFHGNGVAMGSYAGKLLAMDLLEQTPDVMAPDFLRKPPGRFPLGAMRRALLAPAYFIAERFDL